MKKFRDYFECVPTLETERFLLVPFTSEMIRQAQNGSWSIVFDNFDCIIHPWSNGYISDVRPVWKECARVLKKNGLLLAGFGNPIEHIFDAAKLEKGVLCVRNSIPYADIDHLDNPVIKAIVEKDGYIWGHTLEDQIQGQIEAGFAIVGFYEDSGGSVLDQYINSSIATKAIKL